MTATAQPKVGDLRARGLPVAVLFAAEFLVMLDGMVVSVALPVIQRDLHIATSNLQWVVTGSRRSRPDSGSCRSPCRPGWAVRPLPA